MHLTAAAVPLLDGALELERRNRTGGAETNREHFGAGATVSPAVSEHLRGLLYDPQTSGGLLVAVNPSDLRAAQAALAAAGVNATDVGEVTARGESLVVVF
jgi:selenide,water dikinase